MYSAMIPIAKNSSEFKNYNLKKESVYVEILDLFDGSFRYQNIVHLSRKYYEGYCYEYYFGKIGIGFQ